MTELPLRAMCGIDPADDPRWPGIVAALASIYPGEPRKLYQSIEHPAFADWTVARSDARLDAILAGLRGAHAPLGDPVLDIGCCTGRVDRHLARAGYHVHGLDGYQRLIDVAKFFAEAFALPCAYECRTDAREVAASRRWSAVLCPSTFHPALAAGQIAEVADIWTACLDHAAVLVLDDAWPGDAGAPPWDGFPGWLRGVLGPVRARALVMTEGRTLYAVTREPGR